MLSFIHISDCHLLNTASETNNGINTFESLSHVINDIRQKQKNFDFVLATGDISETNTLENYTIFKQYLSILDCPVYCLPGNHDNASLLSQVFCASPDKTITLQKSKKHLLILINDQCYGHQSGEISTSQLDELDIQLKKNKLPAIVGLHHHPIKIGSPWLDNIRLNHGERFLMLLEKYALVKLVLFGHVHQEIHAMHKHIKILGTPSTAYQFKPQTKIKTLHDLAPGYRTIRLSSSGKIHTQVHRVPYV